MESNPAVESEPDLARVAATVGDASRIAMLLLLMEGRALTAKELALGVGISPATATTHLRRLLDDGLLESTAQGRHKYFRFASADVAKMVEALMRVAPPRKVATASGAADPVRQARFCYDHLAGSLGTGLLAMLLKKGWLADSTQGAGQLDITIKGEKALAALGLDLDVSRGRRRQLACRCLDWSERQDHLAGALGAALAERFKALRWIERKKHSRIVRVTASGTEKFKSLGVRLV